MKYLKQILQLHEQGILGLNRRIGSYILPLNPRHRYPIVDNKITTAALAKKHGIPMPLHYLEIKDFGVLRNLSRQIKDLPGFVIKPSRGAMGNGILVVSGFAETDEAGETASYLRPNGKRLTGRHIEHHISSILSGLFSLTSVPDQAIIQEKIDADPVLGELSHSGLPDIRLIVHRGSPVMAMLRLPTRESGGRANLHQGAIGVGVDIGSGRLSGMIQYNRMIDRHPELMQNLQDVTVPYWSDLKTLARKCYDISGLGYLGVDLVIDRQRGPLLLEMNARPGLAIQLANRRGLQKVL